MNSCVSIHECTYWDVVVCLCILKFGCLCLYVSLCTCVYVFETESERDEDGRGEETPASVE